MGFVDNNNKGTKMLNRQYEYYEDMEDQEFDEKKGKPLTDITLYEIMGESFDLWVGNNKQFGYIVELENEDGEISREEQISPVAMDNFARICRHFLFCYDKIQDKC